MMTVINLQVSYSVGNFLFSSVTVVGNFLFSSVAVGFA